MLKEDRSAIATLSLSLSLICLSVLPAVVLADETLTITTYYPSPYGSYNELKVASNTYLAYSSGSVGIGTTSPESALHVTGTAYPLGIFERTGLASNIAYGVNQLRAAKSTDMADGFGPRFVFSIKDNGVSYQDIAAFGAVRGGADSYGKLIFQTAGASGNVNTVRMVIDSTGNVGIGTTSPTAKLEVAGTAGTDGIKFPDGSTQFRGVRIYRTQVAMGTLSCGGTFSPSLPFTTTITNEWVTLMYSVTGRTNACGHTYGDMVIDGASIAQGSGADERGCTWRRTITQMVNRQIATAGNHTFRVDVTCGSGATTFSDTSGEWSGGGTFLTVIAGGGN